VHNDLQSSTLETAMWGGLFRDTPMATGLRYGRRVFLLVLALGVGLIPVVAMNRRPWDFDDGMSSRFGLAYKISRFLLGSL
jgi:hypothetical protein